MPDMASIAVNPTASSAGIKTALHRVRFVDYHPSPITSLAFTPVPFPSPDPAAVHGQGNGQGSAVIKNEMGALVCARQNGEVQVWEWAEGEKEDKVDEVTGSWVLRRVSERYGLLWWCDELWSLISFYYLPSSSVSIFASTLSIGTSCRSYPPS